MQISPLGEAVMEQIERARHWIDARRDLALEAVRMYLGVALIAKGLAFATDRAQLASVDQLGWAAGFAAHYVVPAHIVGGLFLLIGFLTRAAAIVNVPILLGAVLFVHGAQGLFSAAGSLELDMLVLFLLLVFTVVGAGRYSVDHYMEAHASRPRPSLA
jgi:uncharacterized membrane protein YphA (DoxX/SURF4 family)